MTKELNATLNSENVKSDFVSEFNRLAKAARSVASLFRKKLERPLTEIEQVQQHVSAFLANAKNAAARRMQLYLKATHNHSILSASHAGGKASEEVKESEELSTAFKFMLASEISRQTIDAALTSTALTQVGFMFEGLIQRLEELLKTEEVKAAQLDISVANKESEIFATQADLASSELGIKQAGEALRESSQAADMAEARSHEYYASNIVSLENRAIKIVWPGENITELRNSLRNGAPLTPEIYIVTDQKTPDGKLVYDRISKDKDGNTVITSVSEDNAPADLMKQEGQMYTDMIERAFHRHRADGTVEFVKTKFGADYNEPLGALDPSSQAMLGQYLTLMHKHADDVTPCGEAYEQRLDEQDALYNDHGMACSIANADRCKYNEAKRKMAYVIEALEDKKAELMGLKQLAHSSHERIRAINHELIQTRHMIRLAGEYDARLRNGEFVDFDDMVEQMPQSRLKTELCQAHEAAMNMELYPSCLLSEQDMRPEPV